MSETRDIIIHKLAAFLLCQANVPATKTKPNQNKPCRLYLNLHHTENRNGYDPSHPNFCSANLIWEKFHLSGADVLRSAYASVMPPSQ
ncbi:hypothetical protein E2C01_074118 [Portunus trituberculatus]|uniref:Uncharacterized protein n=1 Tax=Portunus trituberculatus TaxID=210409 RepID=A0A5B7IBC5_PORTR|nr:hypothetical protein [Portunus trituberculatus]